ncbi:pol protein [Cucumis melo var. makuwa]|uniref:Pol protein n=1 Tax=Cucumis melo var. makuwa TaxID=1194695 RepID=A0A5A7TXJ1_CUCMM|nr:pol protein [Cucumis melo var. makuwa]
MLRVCVLEFSRSWDSHLHLMEFTYNNSYQATIGMAPFEALYDRRCRSPVCWGEKSYADVRHKNLEFDVGDMVFLKEALMNGVLRFEKKGKLSPLHDVFNVSMLRMYVADLMHVVDCEPLQINQNLSYEEQPVEILAREVKMLRNRGISLVKVLWQNHGVEEATWEREDDMRVQYPELKEKEKTLTLFPSSPPPSCKPPPPSSVRADRLHQAHRLCRLKLCRCSSRTVRKRQPSRGAHHALQYSVSRRLRLQPFATYRVVRLAVAPSLSSSSLVFFINKPSTGIT